MSDVLIPLLAASMVFIACYLVTSILIAAMLFSAFVNFTTLPGDLKDWILHQGLSPLMVVTKHTPVGKAPSDCLNKRSLMGVCAVVGVLGQENMACALRGFSTGLWVRGPSGIGPPSTTPHPSSG